MKLQKIKSLKSPFRQRIPMAIDNWSNPIADLRAKLLKRGILEKLWEPKEDFLKKSRVRRGHPRILKPDNVRKSRAKLSKQTAEKTSNVFLSKLEIQKV